MSDRFVAADDENLHTGDAWGTPMNPYARLAFAKGLHARLGAGADSVLAHLREELLCEQIVSTTVRAVRQDIHGHTYEGEWKDGKRHGQGKFTYASGDTYEGEWKDGKSHGQGKLTYPGGNTYEGEFKDGKYHGQGKYANRHGRIYEGEWKDGKRRSSFVYAALPINAGVLPSFLTGSRAFDRGVFSFHYNNQCITVSYKGGARVLTP